MMKSVKPSLTVRPYEHKIPVKILHNREKSANSLEKSRNITFRVKSWLGKIKRCVGRPVLGILFKLNLARLSVWIWGLCIYLILLMVVQNDSEELLTEEDHQSLQEWVNENEDVMRLEYHRRGNLAHDVCNEYDVYSSQKEFRNIPGRQNIEYSDWLALKRINWNYMYYVPAHDLVYCKVPKSGSSTWVYNLLKLARVPENKISSDIGLHKILRDYYPQMSSTKMKKVFKRSYKFMVVRHPFDRILSAFRDKMEDYQRDLKFRDGYYYTMYGKNIVKVYRDQNDIHLANRTEPTWVEFVKYLINTPASKFDEHWKPIFMLCSPCVLKYDLIAKMDTFSEDTQFIINQLGLEDRLHVEWIHRTGQSKTSELARNYFSQLTKRQMDNLYYKYHLDFELFRYDYDDYRLMAQDN